MIKIKKMKNINFKKILIVAFLFSFFVFNFALAGYQLLEPIPEEGGAVKNPTLSGYLSALFSFALAAAAFLAVLQITIAGIQMTLGGANESARKDAKERISDAVWGLVLALSAWLLLFTINPDFVEKGLQIPGLTIQEGAGFIILQEDVFYDPEPGNRLSYNNVRDNFGEEGDTNFIDAKPECVGTQNTGCARLAGLKEATVEETVDLKEECESFIAGCRIYITSGTESGHATGGYSHSNGYKVDIKPDTNLDNYIKNSGKFILSSESAEREVYLVKNSSGDVLSTYVYEKEIPAGANSATWAPHWDVTVYRSN